MKGKFWIHKGHIGIKGWVRERIFFFLLKIPKDCPLCYLTSGASSSWDL